MKTGTLVNRLVLTLFGFSIAFLSVGASGQTLNLYDIPDQTVNQGQSFSVINLDNFIDVPAKDRHKIKWDATGADQLSVNIDNDRQASVAIPSNTWTGSETITFHATDTELNTGSDAAIFTVKELVNAAPVVSDIPNQQFEEGTAFQPISLDNYVSDADNTNDQLTWSASGNSALSVNINASTHTAVVAAPNIDWNGSETIVFQATDPQLASSQDAATFTLTPVNDPPVVSNILDQSIKSNESFSTISLDNYVTDVDNTKAELSWSITGNTSLLPSIDGSHVATINKPDGWTGSEKLTFTVNDPSNASAADDATFEVKAVNAVPVAVNDSYSTTQGATLNITAPAGVLSNDTDADNDPLTAIKVTDPAHGTLTLNSDGSFSYVNDGTASTTDAFTYKASDGTNESNVATVTINITLVNVAPVLGGIEGSTLAYTEGDGAVNITGSITATDADDANLASAVITISSNYQNGEDVLSFSNGGGISGSWNASSGQLSLSGGATVASYQAALRSVKYTNNSANPSNLTRTVTFRVSDGTDNSNTQSRNISVTATNIAPVLGGIESGTLAYTEGSGAVSVTGTITATDADNSSLASAVISISNNYQNGEDVLSFVTANGITGSWNASTGQLTLSGTSSVTNYRNALRAVKYTNNSITPSTLTRTVTFMVNDGTDNSNTQSRNISVTGINSAPVLASIESGTLAYTEGDGPVSITNTITVSDADNSSLASAVISISNNYQNGEDVLSFVTANGITGSWNASAGQLTLSGTSSVANYRTALRAVKYTNSSAAPSTLTRTVTFMVDDGTDNSNTQSRNISVTATNIAPVLGGIEAGTLAYTEGNGAVSVTGTITVTDADNTNLASAVISISNNYQNGEDVLSFVTANGITGSWNASTGQLTLSGTASVTNYRNALRAVKYTNNSITPSTLTRTVTFMVNDGTDNSNTQSRNISVTGINSAPVLASIESGTLAYTEGDGPVSITNTITVSDADNSSLASAVVSISNNYQNGEDVLSFVTANGITGSWNASTGQLTLSGTSSVANYRTALRAVKYTNSSAAPSTLTRTVTFMVDDGTDNSNTQSRNISVTPTNIAPVLSAIESGTLAYTEGDGAVIVTGTISASDADNTNLASAIISISNNYQNGEDVLSFTNANGITGSWNATTGQLTLSGTSSVTNYRNALRAVRYTNNSASPSALTRTVTFLVNDGTDNSNTQSRNISVTGINSAPVLASIESGTLAYTEGDGPVSVTGTITVTDVDNANLSSALITISSNYQNGEDALSFATANGITGSWDASTGQLTLSGSSSVLNYRNALRAVKYTNNSATPSTLTRTVTFRVNDGTGNSNTQSRNISVTGTNSAPVLAGIESTTLAYTEGDGPVSITGTITVSDPDNANMSSALITISANYQNGEDVLSFATASGITGSWNAATGQLTLSGSSSVANYRTALRSVKYTNTSGTPATLTRTVTFLVNDGTDNSNTQSRNISVNAFNSAPVLGGTETTALSYTEGAGPVSITSTITATDADDASLAAATVTVSGNYQNGEDVLSFTTANGITASWSAGSGQLTLSGIATVASYQAALRSVKYTNTSTNPNTAPRNITFRVSDGTDNSNLQSRNIVITAVNNAPVIAGIEATAIDYTEGDGAVSLSGSLTVTDNDNLTLQSAVVSISANYKNPQDVLSYTNANGITGSWNATTGQLTLSGTVSPANYQAALRSVKYTNTSNNPSTATRTVSFQVSDGALNSTVVNRDITVTRVGTFSGNISGSASFCTPGVMPIILNIADGTAPFTATLRRTGSVANKDTVITGIATFTYTINVKLTGSYELTSLTDANNEVATVTSTPVVLAFYTKPSGVLSGGAPLCQDGTSKSSVTVNLSGTSPWTYTIRRGSTSGNDTTLTGVTSDPNTFKTRITSSPMTVRLVAISDAHCAGDTTGSGTLRISYLASPNAAIQGQDSICPAGTGNLKLTITGTTGPWNITYKRDGANPVDINVPASPFNLAVQAAGTYTLSKVQQTGIGGCTGKVSGSGRIVARIVPTATLSGSPTFCQFETGSLNVNLTGDSPWKFSYKHNSDTVVVENVKSSPNTFSINKAGTYTLVNVIDQKKCMGTVSGSANVTITPAPDVSMSGLAPAYDKNSEQMVTLTGNPSGGSFTGSSALFNSNGNWFFLPRYAPAGTYNIVYSYRDGSTQCVGYDTTTVRVLEANAIIEFPENRLKYCQNEVPFDITGVNLADNIGSFTISGDAGLVDHGNNTATVDPSVLSTKEYTITYTYFDGTTLNVKSTFEVGKSPVADFKWESECYEKDQPIEFKDASSSTFGNITAYHWKVYTTTGYDTASTPDITYTYTEAGNHVIELQVETSYGCSGVVSKVFGLRPTIIPHKDGFVTETFENNPLSWRSATPPTPTTNSWVLGTPDGNTGINHAASGTTCWFTNLPSSDAPREQSWVSSPCYDLTGLNRPMLKMQIWRDFNGRRDGAVLQATTDSAKTWFNIGQLDDGLNWFNEYSILGNPGNQSIGWSSIQDGNWKEARHSLDMLKGKTRVQFRIAYGSDGTVQNTDGFAFDDFWIGERDRRVLLEHFTNVSDASSQKADSTLNALVDSDSLNTVDVQYHTSFPGDDPFNAQEPYAPSARLLYYGVSEVPFAILNGGYETGYRFDYDSHDGDEPKDLDANMVHLESLKDADFGLKFDSHFSPDMSQALISLEINSMSPLPSREYTIHAGVYERRATATGINGETVYRNVVRALLPDAAGYTYSGPWIVNGQRNYEFTWPIPEGVKPEQLYAFAFIQDEGTQEIYQVNTVRVGEATGTVDVPSSHDKFIVFPNPANDHAFIRFDKPQRNEVRIDMYNNLGSLVYTEILKQTDTDAEIKTDQYPDGLYIIRATSGNQLLGVSKLNITR